MDVLPFISVIAILVIWLLGTLDDMMACLFHDFSLGDFSLDDDDIWFFCFIQICSSDHVHYEHLEIDNDFFPSNRVPAPPRCLTNVTLVLCCTPTVMQKDRLHLRNNVTLSFFLFYRSVFPFTSTLTTWNPTFVLVTWTVNLLVVMSFLEKSYAWFLGIITEVALLTCVN